MTSCHSEYLRGGRRSYKYRRRSYKYRRRSYKYRRRSYKYRRRSYKNRHGYEPPRRRFPPVGAAEAANDCYILKRGKAAVPLRKSLARWHSCAINVVR